MLVPIGLDNARLSRWPRASTAIVAICVLAFLGTVLSSANGEAREARREAVQYLVEHPYLSTPETLRARLDLGDLPSAEVPPGVTPDEVAREQEQLEALSEAFAAAQDATPVYRWSLVPGRGAVQPGWITYQFMHGGLGHLLGNLLVFVLLVGPFLEDAWGAAFFAGFYLLGGVVAAMAQVPFMGPDVPLLGASGSISACLGAFALRFAHRRVRMFYWWFLFLRGQFLVPAWLYALFGFGMDLLSLQLSGGGGGVAYACHVGGFLFGAAVALAVRATRLEERIAPEGAVRWRDGLDLNRAAEALAGGDVAGARQRLREQVHKRPDHAEARLELARLEAGAFDAVAATEVLEPVLARRIGAGDLAGARALLTEFRGKLRADALRPATAYRAAELVEGEDEPFALALYEAAGKAGGGLGQKALLKAAQRLASADPERARDLLDRAELLAGDGEGRARVEALRAALPGQASAAQEPAAAPADIREIRCRVTAIDGGRLDLATADGHAARLDPSRVALVAVALLERFAAGGAERANVVVLDLLLHASAGEPQVLLRLAAHELGLQALRPEVAPADAFADLVEAILLEGGATPWPDPSRVQGKPFARFPDLDAFERACYGRALARGEIARAG